MSDIKFINDNNIKPYNEETGQGTVRHIYLRRGFHSGEVMVCLVVKKDISAGEIIDVIKKSGGRLLTNIDIFDVYTGENVKEDEKSIAFNLTFADSTRTLNDEEVMEVFNNIITNVTTKLNATLRDK